MPQALHADRELVCGHDVASPVSSDRHLEYGVSGTNAAAAAAGELACSVAFCLCVVRLRFTTPNVYILSYNRF